MGKKREDKALIVKEILLLITEGKSLRKSLLDVKMSSRTFFEEIEKDEEIEKQFVRACDIRQRILLDECVDIADDDEDDEKPFVGVNHIQRDKLKVQTRLDVLARMNPKKYGNKIDVTSKDEQLKAVTITGMVITNETKEDEKEED